MAEEEGRMKMWAMMLRVLAFATGIAGCLLLSSPLSGPTHVRNALTTEREKE